MFACVAVTEEFFFGGKKTVEYLRDDLKWLANYIPTLCYTNHHNLLIQQHTYGVESWHIVFAM